MRSIEERLRTYGKSAVCRPDESKIKDTIVISRKSFYEGAEQSEPHYFAFLYEQMGYIRKRWWLLQFLVLFLTGWSVHDLESGFYMQRILGIEAALFVIMVIPEMWKSRSSYSLEVEGAAYYSLRQIYAARMLLFAFVEYTACFFVMLWSAVWFFIVLNDRVYGAVSRPVWIGVLSAAVLYLTYAVRRVMRMHVEELGERGEW